MSQASSPCDCLFTGIAVTVLLAKGSWSLAKRSTEEGWLTCTIGWHGAGRAVRHLCSVSAQFFECIATIVIRVLRELGPLFYALTEGTGRALSSGAGALRSGRECVSWVLSPHVVEAGGACRIGANTVVRASRGFWQGCARTAGLFHAAVSPLLHEACQTTFLGLEMGKKTGGALAGVCRSGSEITHAVLDGFAREFTCLFVQMLEEIGKTGSAVQGSINSWLGMSKESSYCLLLEAAAACGIGYNECLKIGASLPPALRAFLSIPAAGIAALLLECGQTLKIGADQLPKTFHSIYHATVAGIDLLRATLLASLKECAHTAKIGVELSQKTLYALIQAIDHGTEGLRGALLAFLLEGKVSALSGGRSILRTAYAVQQAIIYGGEVAACFLTPLLRETVAMLEISGISSLRTFKATVRALTSATDPIRGLAFRVGVEAVNSIRHSGQQACELSGQAFMQGAKTSVIVPYKWLFRTSDEVGGVARKGLQEVCRFNHQMSHNASRSLNVFVFCPIEEAVYPKIRAIGQQIDAIIQAIEQRMGAIIG